MTLRNKQNGLVDISVAYNKTFPPKGGDQPFDPALSLPLVVTILLAAFKCTKHELILISLERVGNEDTGREIGEHKEG